MENIVVLDIGKTNVKLMHYSLENLQLIKQYKTENHVLKGEHYDHMDIDGIWLFILDSLQKINQSAQIDAISITTHGATAALLSNDRLAFPVMDYEYELGHEIDQKYTAFKPNFHETYSPPLPHGLNLAKQLLLLSDHSPEAFNKVTDILMYPQFWAWKLTGVKASEITSFGVHTDLWDLNKKDFSSLVKAQNWQKLFPPFRPANDIIGSVSNGIMQKIGAKNEIKVVTGIHDSNASIVPHIQEKDNKKIIISSGTWTILMNLDGSLKSLDPQRDSLANINYLGRNVPTARFMGGREFDLLTNGAFESPSETDLKIVIDQQFCITPGLTAETGPFPNAKHQMNFDRKTLSQGEYSAIVSLYLTMMCYHSALLTGDLHDFIIEGALCNNHSFGALLAQLSGKNVFFSKDSTGTSLGALMLLTQNLKPQTQLEKIEAGHFKKLQSYAKNWLSRAVR